MSQLEALRKRLNELSVICGTDNEFTNFIVEDGVIQAILQQDYEVVKRLTTGIWLDYYINIAPEFEVASTTVDALQQLSIMIAGVKTAYSDLQAQNKELEGQVTTLVDSILGDQAQLWSDVYKFDDAIEDIKRKVPQNTAEIIDILRTIKDQLPESSIGKRCAAQLKLIGEL